MAFCCLPFLLSLDQKSEELKRKISPKLAFRKMQQNVNFKSSQICAKKALQHPFGPLPPWEQPIKGRERREGARTVVDQAEEKGKGLTEMGRRRGKLFPVLLLLFRLGKAPFRALPPYPSFSF